MTPAPKKKYPNERAMAFQRSHSSLMRNILQAAGGQQAVVPALPFMQQLGLGDAPGENHRVHGEFLQSKMGVEEVNRKNETRRQQRLVGMHDEGDVNHPARHETGKEQRKPHDQAGHADGKNAPEDREVIELLPISPPVELRLGPFAEKPFLMRDEILRVLQGGDHRVRAEKRPFQAGPFGPPVAAAESAATLPRSRRQPGRCSPK